MFNIFKKKKGDTRKKASDQSVTVFDDHNYHVSESDFFAQKDYYTSLNPLQKAAIIVAMGSFRQIFILKDTYQRDYVDSLMSLREKMLEMPYEKAKGLISGAKDITSGLSSIKDKRPIDCLLEDMKYMLRVLVVLSFRFRDGAEVNRMAVNTLYGIFLPLGYEKLKIHNPRDFMM